MRWTTPLTLMILGGLLTQAPAFEPVQPELFAEGGALVNAWADSDGNGDLDLFVGFTGAPANRLYRNDRGRFTDVADDVGLADARATRAAAWGDYDGDGDPDLLLGFTPGDAPVLRLYRNDGARFTDVTATAGIAIDSAAVRQPVWIDFDGDGDLDLFVAFRDRANAMFRNNSGSFRDVAGDVGLADSRRSVGAIWLDIDDDRELDVVVGNMDGDANGVFRNDAGRFTDVAALLGLAWGGRAPAEPTNGTVRPCAADVNGDGRLDLFFANYGPNGLFLNRGNDRFDDVSQAWGIAIDGRYDTCAFGDFDHDGLVDLYVNGTTTGGVSHPDYLFRNTGASFEDVTPANVRALHASHGAQWADFDGDGDVDLALAGVRPDATHSLLRNALDPADAARSLQMLAVDDAGRATLAGTVIELREVQGGRLLGVGLVDAGSGYDSQSIVPVHFGVARATRVDAVIAVRRGAPAVIRDLDVARWAGRVLHIRVGGDGRAWVVE